ncbi:hypothetical protein SDC9_135937 [bioreactor metagenome]|uniref:Uncharacterized protein n=1 Tax=bioreactor metagenome TaxID=1076179 RepID=A0A645DJ38_9ZZZZ
MVRGAKRKGEHENAQGTARRGKILYVLFILLGGVISDSQQGKHINT